MRFMRFAACGAAVLFLISSPPQAQADDVTPTALIDALNGVFGKPQGTRSSHPKGVCAVGSFKASAEAASISKAGMFDGREAPSVIRFSIGSGNPKVSDKNKAAARGIAFRVSAADGDAEFVFISAPIFFARTPAQMVAFLQARAPDPATGKPDPEKVKAFSAANPETTRQAAYLNRRPLPASYADASYFGVNTFFFVNARGEKRAARWIVRPAAGEVTISDEELKAKPDNFYQDALAARLSAKPAEFDLFLQFAEAGDDLLDPTVAWPDSRKTAKMGRLTITTLATGDVAKDCDQSIFNPVLLTDGIEPSDDPILQARAAAYAESLSRRTQ